MRSRLAGVTVQALQRVPVVTVTGAHKNLPDEPMVLVVDDDVDIQTLLSGLLTKAGYRVEVANSGAEAILLLEQIEPSVMLVDLLMPGIVGQELLEYLRASPHLANVPVAIVSGSPELAPDGYRLFRKPVSFRSLLEFVKESCAPPVRE